MSASLLLYPNLMGIASEQSDHQSEADKIQIHISLLFGSGAGTHE